MFFSSKNDQETKCSVKLFRYIQLKEKIKNRKKSEHENSKVIHQKWIEHSSYFPRPWPSYRSNIEGEIRKMEDKQNKIKLELTELRNEKNNLHNEINECIKNNNIHLNVNVSNNSFIK